MSRLLALMVLVGLVLAGLHYGREGGTGTTARGASLVGAGGSIAQAGNPIHVGGAVPVDPSPHRPVGGTLDDRGLSARLRSAFSPNRDLCGGDGVIAAGTAAVWRR